MLNCPEGNFFFFMQFCKKIGQWLKAGGNKNPAPRHHSLLWSVQTLWMEVTLI